MGMVFKAEQTSVGRTVALKVLRPQIARDTLAVKRFFREARLASSLSHPNTVTVYDFARTDDGVMYISMEYVEGVPLDRFIANEAPLPAHRAMRITNYITDSLGEAHSMGLVHRDLKPANIIIQQRFGKADFARVLDFGIAKSVGDSSTDGSLTSTGAICGTPAYMSPEQTAGATLDGRSDIYALGCVLYEMLTGKAPFSGNTPVEIMMGHTSKPFPALVDPQGAALDVDGEVEALIHKMTQKKPENRLTAQDLRNELALLGYGSGTDPNIPAGATDLRSRQTGTTDTQGGLGQIKVGDTDDGESEVDTDVSGPTIVAPSALSESTVTVRPVVGWDGTQLSTQAAMGLTAGRSGKIRVIGILVGLALVGGVFLLPGDPPDKQAGGDQETPAVSPIKVEDAAPEAPTIRTIKLTCAPDKALVTLDGEAVGSCPSVTLTGSHDASGTLTIQMAGYKTLEQHIDNKTPDALSLILLSENPATPKKTK
jgi:serine/threonine-protein kinase